MSAVLSACPPSAFIADRADWHVLFSKAKGPKVTLMIGAVVVAVGYGLGIVLMSAVWQLVLVSAVIGAGIGFAYGAMPALIMGAVPVSETAAANSLNTLMRSIGTSVSSVLAGVILAQMTVTLGSVSVLSQNGFRVILAIGAGAALAAFTITAFIPSRRPTSEPSPTATAEAATVA